MTTPNTVGRLTDVETVEVSIVDRAANKRRFAILKSEGNQMEEVIQNVLDVEVEGEEVISKTEGVSEKGQAALTSILRLAKGFEDEVTGELLLEVLKSAGAVEVPEAPAVEEVETEEVVEVVKAEDLPEEAQALFKMQHEAIQKAEARVAEIEKELNAAKEEKAVAEFTKKAETDYPELGDAVEVGSVLKALADHEVFEKLETLLKAANEKIAKGGLFEELAPVTKDAESATAGTAYQQMVKKAQELVATKGGKAQDHMFEVMRANPDLVEQDRAEKEA